MTIITEKIIKKAIEIASIAERDEKLYGDSYVEFGERSIRILDPTKIKINLNPKGKIKNIVYGKSVLKNNKNGKQRR
jgi:hypothetical protein